MKPARVGCVHVGDVLQDHFVFHSAGRRVGTLTSGPGAGLVSRCFWSAHPVAELLTILLLHQAAAAMLPGRTARSGRPKCDGAIQTESQKERHNAHTRRTPARSPLQGTSPGFGAHDIGQDVDAVAPYPAGGGHK